MHTRNIFVLTSKKKKKDEAHSPRSRHSDRISCTSTGWCVSPIWLRIWPRRSAHSPRPWLSRLVDGTFYFICTAMWFSRFFVFRFRRLLSHLQPSSVREQNKLLRLKIGRRTPTSGPITVRCRYKTSTGRYVIYIAQPRLSLSTFRYQNRRYLFKTKHTTIVILIITTRRYT